MQTRECLACFFELYVYTCVYIFLNLRLVFIANVLFQIFHESVGSLETHSVASLQRYFIIKH